MLFVGFFTGIVLLAFGFYHFDKLLRHQYENHRPQWEHYGKPAGFFWSPPESSFVSGSIQRSIRVLSWTFVTEQWMRQANKMSISVWLMRASFFAFWLLWILIGVFGLAT